MVPNDYLREIPFFEGTPLLVLEEIGKAARVCAIPPNTYLLHQHDEINFVRFLISGKVQVFLQFQGMDKLFVGKIQEAGGLVGWSAFRSPYRSTSTIRTEGDCEVLEIPRETIEQLLRDHPDFGYLFLERVAESLANRLEISRDLLVMAQAAHAK